MVHMFLSGYRINLLWFLIQDDGGLAADFHNLGLGRFGSQDGSRFGGSEGGRLGQGSAPINIVGYQSGSSAHHHHMSSALLAGPDLPGSPSNSIWTPSPVLDKLLPVSHHSPSNGVNHSLNQMHVLNQGGMSQPLGLPSIKTVAELEEELKMQQQSRDQTPHGLHMNVNTFIISSCRNSKNILLSLICYQHNWHCSHK